MRPMRVIVMCCDGLFQRHLLARAAEEFSLVGIVMQTDSAYSVPAWRRLKRYGNPKNLLRHLAARVLLPSYERRAQPLIQRLFYHEGWPRSLPADVPCIATPEVNGSQVSRFIREHAPDIILVNGTNLLREGILSLLPEIKLGIINLHTGLSPYSRGGNCNLFMLLEGHPELVGVTVHHIDKGIDSGDIILSSQLQMEPGDTLEMIDARGFQLGIEMLLRAARQLQDGCALRVGQWDEGKVFLRRTGYVYEPYHRLRANRAIDRGLVRDYLADRDARDAGVRLVGETSA
jgi:methionyl-tRNA formyltransferase